MSKKLMREVKKLDAKHGRAGRGIDSRSLARVDRERHEETGRGEAGRSDGRRRASRRRRVRKNRGAGAAGRGQSS